MACAACRERREAQTIELKISHFVPPNHTFHKWVTAWSDKLAKDSGGRLKFTIYPNGQLVGPPNRQLDAARNAITDMAFVLHGVTPGRYSATELGNLPFTWPKAGIRQRHHVEAPERARPDLPRQGAHRAAHHLHGGGEPGRVLFQGADPLARRLQGQEGPLRRRAEQVPARCARRRAAAGAAARGAGRARQGHRRSRHVPA